MPKTRAVVSVGVERELSKLLAGLLGVPPDGILDRLGVQARACDAFPFAQLLLPSGCRLLDGWLAKPARFVAFKVSRIGWYV